MDRSRALLGALLIAAGVIFLLDATDVVPAGEIFSQWWPAVIILLGLIALLGRPRSLTGGGVLIVIGGVLLLATLDVIDVPVWQLIIALALIGGGLSLVIRGFRRGGSPDPGNRVTFSVILGEHRVISEASAFRNGSVTSILGEAALDLRNATLDPAGATVDAFCLLGDTTVLVPRGWRVTVNGMPVLGEFKDETDHEAYRPDDAPTITVTGVSILADVDVKHND